MIWRKASERQVGGNYTWWDAETDSAYLLPLLYCIGNAIPHRPMDYFLRGIFSDDRNLPCGGDPGWCLYREKGWDGTYAYHAWADPSMSGIEPNEATYDEVTVKRHVLHTLLNYLDAHPESRKEVDAVIAHYRLSGVSTQAEYVEPHTGIQVGEPRGWSGNFASSGWISSELEFRLRTLLSEKGFTIDEEGIDEEDAPFVRWKSGRLGIGFEIRAEPISGQITCRIGSLAVHPRKWNAIERHLGSTVEEVRLSLPGPLNAQLEAVALRLRDVIGHLY